MRNTIKVDAVFALLYTGYKDRYPRLMTELKRVGIDENVQEMWQFPSPYYKWLASKIPHEPFLDKRPGCWGACVGQYKSIKQGYELGLEQILIVEDDCRFIKDLSALDAALSNIPSGWDILMLDHFPMRGEVRQVNRYWASCDAAASTACYIVNRKAMERLIAMYESPVSGKYAHPLMRNCDNWINKKYLGRDIGLFCATPNLAVQCTCPGPSNCGRTHCEPKYASMRIDLNAYAPWDENAPTPVIVKETPVVSPPPSPPAVETLQFETTSPQPVPAPAMPVPPSVPGTVDVLYVVGRGAKGYGDLPLHWSLRSLAKHAKNLGRVIVAGYPPDWLSDEVVKVYAEDKTGGKHWNILNCIAAGIRQAHIDGPFLYSSDDHYLCRDADLMTWPRYERGRLLTLQEYTTAKHKSPGAYQRSLCDTRRCLSEENLSFRKACLHFNTWMDGRDLDEVLAVADRHRSLTRFGFEPTCLFNAIFEKKNPGAKYEHKANGDDRKVHSVADIDAKLKSGLLQFSTPPAAEQDRAIVAKMNSIFPDKCRFEK